MKGFCILVERPGSLSLVPSYLTILWGISESSQSERGNHQGWPCAYICRCTLDVNRMWIDAHQSVDSPCSCGHFEWGLPVTKLWPFKKILQQQLLRIICIIPHPHGHPLVITHSLHLKITKYWLWTSFGCPFTFLWHATKICFHIESCIYAVAKVILWQTWNKGRH